MRTIETVRSGLNQDLAMQGIVLTMYDSRNKLSEQVANDVRSHLGNVVYHTVIPGMFGSLRPRLLVNLH